MLLRGFHYSSFLRIDIVIAIAIDIILTLIIQNQSPLRRRGTQRVGAQGPGDTK
jgi:hypothetical protein